MQTLDQLVSSLADHGASRFLAKILAENDNSKNQFYVGGSSEVFSILPPTEITPDQNQQGVPSFKAALDFSWIDEHGNVCRAPNAQLIYYPQYPEVRLSSLIVSCPRAPSALLRIRSDKRVLVLGVADDRRILGFLCEVPHPIAVEIIELGRTADEGVFITLRRDEPQRAPAQSLFLELCRIARNNWIRGKRLNRDGNLLPCNNSNCAGYTLEAELGISANGYSEPDYLGWEVKTFTLPALDSLRQTVTTLMTPEPTGGVYVSEGVEGFIRRYGYQDLRGRADRLNFGGIFRYGVRQPRTGLTMHLDGANESGELVRADGELQLVDDEGTVGASWAFKGLLEHWNRKHSKSVFVPNTMRRSGDGRREYRFGSDVRVGVGTEFQLLIKSIASGTVYYDPGLKLESASQGRPRVKRRSQFRTKSAGLRTLYHEWRSLDACNDGHTVS